jgi:hypothetical protein
MSFLKTINNILQTTILRNKRKKGQITTDELLIATNEDLKRISKEVDDIVIPPSSSGGAVQTVSDTSTIDLTLTGTDLTADFTGNASDVSINTIGAPTADTVQEAIDSLLSAGWVKDGAINNAGGGNITVDAGEGFIKVADTPTAQLKSFKWSALAPTAIPANTIRYVYVNYNAGAPIVTVSASGTYTGTTVFPLGRVVNEAGTLYILFNPQIGADAIHQTNERFYRTQPFQRADREGGIIIGETAVRRITVTAGTLWDRLNDFPITAINTGAGDSFDSYLGSVLDTAGATQWDNINYNNGGVKTALGANKYANLWFYITAANALIMVYGTAEHNNVASAQAETPPTVIPLRVESHGRIIGRLLFKKSDATAVQIDSAFTNGLTTAGITVHNNLSGLQGGVVDEYYHLTAAEYAALGSAESGYSRYFLLMG